MPACGELGHRYVVVKATGGRAVETESTGLPTATPPSDLVGRVDRPAGPPLAVGRTARSWLWSVGCGWPTKTPSCRRCSRYWSRSSQKLRMLTCAAADHRRGCAGAVHRSDPHVWRVKKVDQQLGLTAAGPRRWPGLRAGNGWGRSRRHRCRRRGGPSRPGFRRY
jgi:hypothetical protein